MTRTLAALAVASLLAACNGPHPVNAPSGIRAESGGGVQQLSRVPGNPSLGATGNVATTRVQ